MYKRILIKKEIITMNTKTIKKTIPNRDVNIIFDYMNGEDYCFSKENLVKNNAKIDTRLSWLMRKNRKVINDIHDMILEARKDIETTYVEAGKIETVTDDNGSEVTKIAKEYETDFINEVNELLNQTNEVEVSAISMEDLFEYPLTELDIDVLSFMIYDIDDDAVDSNTECNCSCESCEKCADTEEEKPVEHVTAEVVE